MIVPMKKVSLVVLDKEREISLEKLREAGIVHLEKKNVSSDSLVKLLDRRARLETALGLLRSYPPPKKSRPETVQATVIGGVLRDAAYTAAGGESSGAGPSLDAGGARPEMPDTVSRVLALGEEKKNFQEQLASRVKEQNRLEPWGNFDPKDFAFLAEKGINLIPYELPWPAYDALGAETKVIVLSRNKTGVRLLAAGNEIPGETPFALPERSLAETGALAADLRNRLAGLEKQLRALAVNQAGLEAELKDLQENIEFESASAGMEIVEGAPREFTVSWLGGFVPQDSLGLLKRTAAENGWALRADDPGPDDPVPTKLKNNRFARLINPLTDFLEVVPGYNEVDISGWFLFFFIIFFGMIFGDAGYGALILTAGVIGIIRTAKKGVPPVLKLLLLLGFSNFVWGTLTCSWFGIEDLNRLPSVLRNISLPLISNVRAAQSAQDKGIVQQNLMIFCFSLALLQLSIGHILAILHDKSLKILGHIGSIAMLAGMYFIILNLIASNEYRRIPLFAPALYIFAAGFVLNFVFANYEGSVGRSTLESLKNIISVILGIANVFSDIMSYIRLWAVGLAGAAIASTVNAMAGPMLGRLVLFIFGMALLLFGHGLNLVLNVLSVLVHGVRLNTLEFSGHAGLAWAGYPYKPFAKRTKKRGDTAA
jgi:V/A-type H+-transporting ATPase subunit I